MRFRQHHRWLAAACCYAIWLAACSDAEAQAPALNDDALLPSAAPFESVPEQPVPEQSESEALWADVPALPPKPRVGWFLLARPSKPGYYSFRDFLQGRYLEAPPAVPYPPTSSDPIPFFDADYRYLDDVPLADRDPFELLKRRHPAEDWMWSLGGEERVRGMHEINSRLTSTTNDYVLTRTRLYQDVWYRDQVRVYAEMQDSQSTSQALPPQRTDVDHSDLLNLFTDIKLGEINDRPAYVRGGRQELNYGSQRLISSADFPNTRRTFSGVKSFWRGKNWDLDAFWVEPVEILANQFDHPDHLQQFVGVWSNYRPAKKHQVDLYYLLLDNHHSTFAGQGGAVGGYGCNTVGSRYAADWWRFTWDFEGMYQFGSWANQRISAGAYTAGVGYHLVDLPWSPEWWVHYDWASGNQNPGGPVHGTFNQLFPFGHAYFGYLDLVGRQNIRDLNTQLSFFPAKWVTTVVQFHVFRLDSARDALYNAAGTAIRQDPTGAAGRDVGDEIDFTVNFHLAKHHELFVGYSKLFAGKFIQRTGPGGSPELTYVSYSFKW